jgi:hypothetical protein
VLGGGLRGFGIKLQSQPAANEFNRKWMAGKEEAKKKKKKKKKKKSRVAAALCHTKKIPFCLRPDYSPPSTPLLNPNKLATRRHHPPMHKNIIC